ncbi:hypothetical protein WB403_50975, partial [Streptomyces brasiliscabiei]
ARSGELDVPLTLLLLAFLSTADRMAYSRPARLAAGLILALAFLLKSFAIIPFVAAVTVYLLWSRGPRALIHWALPGGIVVVTAAV